MFPDPTQGCQKLFHSGQAIPDKKNKRMKLMEYPAITIQGIKAIICIYNTKVIML